MFLRLGYGVEKPCIISCVINAIKSGCSGANDLIELSGSASTSLYKLPHLRLQTHQELANYQRRKTGKGSKDAQTHQHRKQQNNRIAGVIK